MSYWLQDKSIKKQPLIISLKINLFWTHKHSRTNSYLRLLSSIKEAVPDTFLKINARYGSDGWVH